MNRLLWAHKRSLLASILLIALLLICLGGYGVDTNVNTDSARSIVNPAQDVIQGSSSHKLKFNQFASDMDRSILSHVSTCEFIGHRATDFRPVHFPNPDKNRAQAPPSSSDIKQT